MHHNNTHNHTCTVFLSGGHITPAIALLQAIQEKQFGWSIYFLGREKAGEHDRVPSEESRIVSGYDCTWLPVRTGRFLRAFSLSAIVSLFKVPLGIAQCMGYIRKYKPDIVVSFGGYIGFAVSTASFLMRVPFVIHEQASIPGLANTLLARAAQKVYISFPAVRSFFPARKTELTGLPLRKEIFFPPSRPDMLKSVSQPFIYITGGITGSQSVNALVYEALPLLLSDYAVVHQTGRMWESGAMKIKQHLPADMKGKYFPFPYLDISEHSWLLHHAHLVISRSGANTVGEIIATKKKSILIPLPWSARNEQEENARIAGKYAGSVVVDQSRLTGTALARMVRDTASGAPANPDDGQEIGNLFSYQAAMLLADGVASQCRR